MDSPRFAPPLVKRLEEMGGVDYMYLTHRDDVADHQKFHQHFGCDRILHKKEIKGNYGQGNGKMLRLDQKTRLATH